MSISMVRRENIRAFRFAYVFVFVAYVNVIPPEYRSNANFSGADNRSCDKAFAQSAFELELHYHSKG